MVCEVSEHWVATHFRSFPESFGNINPLVLISRKSAVTGAKLEDIDPRRISNERKSIFKMCLAAEGHRLKHQIPDRQGGKIRSIRI